MSNKCVECGFPDHFHHTPPNEMKRCDLDWNCFPKEDYEAVRETIRQLQLKKEVEELKEDLEAANFRADDNSAWVTELVAQNTKLREALEKIKRGDNCNDKTCEHTVDDSCDYNIACEALQTIELDAILRGDK